MKRRLEILTTTALSTFHACPRRYKLRCVDMYEPAVKAHPLRFGSVVHRALEAWWLAAMAHPDEPEMWMLAAIEALGLEEADPLDLVKATVMMQGYHARWSGENMTVLAVEAQFELDLLNPETGAASKTWRLSGKIDAVVLLDGEVWIVEHKTCGEDFSTGSDYWVRLKLDSQVSTYYEGARALGHDVRGCLYDILGKPRFDLGNVAVVDDDGVKVVLDARGERVRTKDGKKWRQTADTDAGYVLQTRPETLEEYEERLRVDMAERPERYFARGPVPRTEEDERDGAFDRWQQAQAIKDAKRLGRFPRNSAACIQPGRRCAFVDVCAREASLDDTSRFIRLETANPELTAA